MTQGAIFEKTDNLIVEGEFDPSDEAQQSIINQDGLPDVNKRIVAMVGFAGSSRAKVNQQPENVEVWGLNSGYTFMERKADLWFDVHAYEGRHEYRQEHWKKMLEMGIPIVALHPPIPTPENVIWLDYEGICERLGAEKYFTNSIAYMIAYAIDDGVDEIRIFGIDMATGTEFAHQRACVEYWLGIAQGRGITVKIASESPILKGQLYAVDRDDGFGKTVMLDQMSTFRVQQREATAQLYQTKGKIAELKGLVESFAAYERDHGQITVEDVRGIMDASLQQLREEEQQHTAQYWVVEGAIQSVKMIIDRLILPGTSHNELDLASDPQQYGANEQVPQGDDKETG